MLVDVSLPNWLVRGFRPKRVHSPAQMRTLFTQQGTRIPNASKHWPGADGLRPLERNEGKQSIYLGNL